MDSLYLTALQDDHLSLQQMMDDDLKREMDLDDCFSFGGDLPSLALDDSLDCKWEFVDNSTSVSNLLSRHTPLHSPTFDANIWYNAGGSSNSNLVPVLENDAASRMVNPNTVIPINSMSPSPMEIEIKREPIDEPISSPIVIKAEPHVEPPIPQQITFATTTTQLPARAKIINKGISLVCSNTNTPFTFVKTNTFNVSNNTLSINEGMATIRCPPARPNKTPQQNPEEKIYPKPAYSYSCLIALALKNSANGSLPVSEIYNFMCEHFPYFKTAPNGWKNSVRHNLSLNKCFEKIEKPSGNGSQRKGCLWAMNPTKLSKMDEEVQKWSRKDPQAIRRAMVIPENLEMLERGEMKRDVASGDDTEEDEDEELSAISPHEEQPFTPPDTEEGEETDPICTTIKQEHEFVDISYLEELDENDIPEFDLDVNDRLYEEMEEEENIAVTRIEASLHHNTTKIQGNYIYKPSPISRPMATAPVSSYVCKPTANGTAVRIRKVQPAILLSSVKRH